MEVDDVVIISSLVDDGSDIGLPFETHQTDIHESSAMRDFAINAAKGNLCRLCLAYNTKMHNIEDVEDHTVEDLQLFASINIEGTDNLTNLVCENCLEFLKSIMKFRKLCHKSEKRLKKLKKAIPDLDLRGWSSYDVDLDDIISKIMTYLKRKTRKNGNIMKTEPIEIKRESEKSLEIKLVDQSDYQSYDDQLIEDENFQKTWSDNIQFKTKNHAKSSGISLKNIPIIELEETEDMVNLKLTNPRAYRKERMKSMCGVCGKLFASKASLRCHYIRKHSTANNYICDECGRTFTSLPELRSHQTVHSSIKKYSCAVCGHRTRLSSGLRSHMRSHSDAKTYMCELCPLKFKRLAQLKKHRDRHIRDKPYQCDLCHKYFSDPRNLVDHRAAIHEGKRKYKCELCPAAFGFREPLRQHRRVVHCETRTLVAKQREREKEEAIMQTELQKCTLSQCVRDENLIK